MTKYLTKYYLTIFYSWVHLLFANGLLVSKATPLSNYINKIKVETHEKLEVSKPSDWFC